MRQHSRKGRRLHRVRLSRTQVLLTNIVKLCQEIRDIKGAVKSNNIHPKLPEPRDNYKHTPELKYIDAEGVQGDNNSSHSTASHQSSDLPDSANKPLANEAHPTQRLPVLIPCVPNLSLNSSPTSSAYSRWPSSPSSSDNSASLLSADDIAVQ